MYRLVARREREHTERRNCEFQAIRADVVGGSNHGQNPGQLLFEHRNTETRPDIHRLVHEVFGAGRSSIDLAFATAQIRIRVVRMKFTEIFKKGKHIQIAVMKFSSVLAVSRRIHRSRELRETQLFFFFRLTDINSCTIRWPVSLAVNYHIISWQFLPTLPQASAALIRLPYSAQSPPSTVCCPLDRILRASMNAYEFDTRTSIGQVERCRAFPR